MSVETNREERHTGRDESSTERDRTNADEHTHLEGEGLVIGYPNAEEPVIDDESITVPEGDVTALIGPNGSGKSTLLKGLARQISLESGTVLLNGRDAHELDSKEFARTFGLLSQENVSPGSLSVEDLVYHGRYPHRGFFESVTQADQDAVDRAISLAGVDHLRDRDVGSLSGGQKQLVWIAMVLAQETESLLLDEPTTFLDIHHQLEVMEIIEALRDHSDVTVVLVLHDIEQATRYADYVLALNDGAIQARGRPAEVVTEELLEEVFGIEARVEEIRDDVRITPVSPLHDDSIETSRQRALRR